MPAVNEFLAVAANLAVRTLVQRQVISTQDSSILTSTDSPLSSPTSLPTVTSSGASSTTVQQATSSSDPSQGQGQGQPTSSPLLFFVALGFGVVFTNLWIIVGVKYCFRYSARNRALRIAEDGEPINMENMPRPHRRRREKKLMTMDEVNEKFPMQKYKNWVASRAQEGLPTSGGVSAPPSRANSVQDVEGVVPEMPKDRDSTDERPTTSATNHVIVPASSEKVKETEEGPAASSAAASGDPSSTNLPSDVEQHVFPHRDDGDEDEDEQINAALPPECLGTSGDTCAICIDTLEDDDDVRGLTCGHAFHAGCLDPWLTSRRACCPLCKADYYTPKPRRTHTNTNANANNELPTPPADGSAPVDRTTSGQPASRIDARRRDHRMNLPQPPRTTWQSLVARGRGIFPGGNRQEASQPRSPGNRQRRTNAHGDRSPRATPSGTASLASPTSPQTQNPGVWHRFRQGFPHFQLQQQSRIQNTNVTPGELESGVRS